MNIVQDWVQKLGLRHQGVLLTAVRGCDLLPREHVSKHLTRAFRADVLNAFVGDPKKSASFIEVVDHGKFTDLTVAVLRDLDVYPVHYLMHLTHAAEILAYKHPVQEIGDRWRIFYFGVCRKLHVNPETETQLDERLNAEEATFKEAQGV